MEHNLPKDRDYAIAIGGWVALGALFVLFGHTPWPWIYCGVGATLFVVSVSRDETLTELGREYGWPSVWLGMFIGRFATEAVTWPYRVVLTTMLWHGLRKAARLQEQADETERKLAEVRQKQAEALGADPAVLQAALGVVMHASAEGLGAILRGDDETFGPMGEFAERTFSALTDMLFEEDQPEARGLVEKLQGACPHTFGELDGPTGPVCLLCQAGAPGSRDDAAPPPASAENRS